MFYKNPRRRWFETTLMAVAIGFFLFFISSFSFAADLGYFQNGSVSPTSGNTSTKYSFNVELKANIAAYIYFVQVWVDGSNYYSMQNIGGVTTPGSTWYGVDNITLPQGNHTYYFRAKLIDMSNQNNWQIFTSSPQSGPNVSAPPQPKAQYQVKIINNDNSSLSTYFKTDQDSSYQGSYNVNANGGVFSSNSIEVAPGAYSVMIKWRYPEKTTDDTLTSSSQQINAGDTKIFNFTIPLYTAPNNLPVLIGTSVSPASGNSGSQFTYQVTYTDADNDAPTIYKVNIDGTEYSMSKVSGTYSGGAVYQYATTSLAAGSHSYSFRFNDGKGADVATSTLSGPTVNTVDHPPTLSNPGFSPASGNAGTSFTFQVTYTDADGDAPTVAKVHIDAGEYDMAKTSGTYSGGAVYKYSTSSLPIGSHNYYFRFNDGKSSDVQTVLSVGPTVTGTNSPPSVSIVTPANNATVNGAVNISVSGFDTEDGKLSKVEYYIDNLLKFTDSAPLAQTPCSTFSWDTTQNSNSAHKIKVIGYDSGGLSTSSEVAVTVNNIAKGNISITVKNINGALVPGAGVIRYTTGWSPIDAATTDANGVAGWTGVPAGTYAFEVWQNGEFWGNPANLTVNAGQTTSVVFNRYLPYCESVNSDVSLLNAGGTVTLSVSVRNLDQSQNNVKVRLRLDRNKDSSSDFDQTCAPLTIPANSSKTFNFSFTPVTGGDYFYAVEVSSEVKGNYIRTDSSPFGSSKLFTVAPTGEVYLEHRSGQIFKEADDPVIYKDELGDYTLVVKCQYAADFELSDFNSLVPNVYYSGPMVNKGDHFEGRYQFKASDLKWDPTQPEGNDISIKLSRLDQLVKPYYEFYRFHVRSFGRNKALEELDLFKNGLNVLADYLAAQKDVNWVAEQSVQYKEYTVSMRPVDSAGSKRVEIQMVSKLDSSVKRTMRIGPKSFEYEILRGNYKTIYDEGRISQALGDLSLVKFELNSGKKIFILPDGEKLTPGSQSYDLGWFSKADDAGNAEKYLIHDLHIKNRIYAEVGDDTLTSTAGDLLGGALLAVTMVESANMYLNGPEDTSKAAANLAGFFGGGWAAGETATLIGTGGIAGGICSAGVGFVVGGLVYVVVDEILPHPLDPLLSKDVKAGDDAYLEFSLRNHGSQKHTYKITITGTGEQDIFCSNSPIPLLGSGCTYLGDNRYSLDKGGYANIKIKLITSTCPRNYLLQLSFLEEETGLKWDVSGKVSTSACDPYEEGGTCTFNYNCVDHYQLGRGAAGAYSSSLSLADKSGEVNLTWPSLDYKLSGRDFSSVNISRSPGLIDISVPPRDDAQILAASPAKIVINNIDPGYCAIKHNGTIVYQNGRIVDESMISNVVWDKTNKTLTFNVSHWDDFTVISDPGMLAPCVKSVIFDGRSIIDGDFVSSRSKIEVVMDDKAASIMSCRIDLVGAEDHSIVKSFGSLELESSAGCVRAQAALSDTLPPGSYFVKVTITDAAGNSVIYDSPRFRVSGAFSFSAMAGPNPFSPNSDGISDTTKISYQLSQDSRIKIRVFDLSGRAVKAFDYDAGIPGRSAVGYNEVEWNGRDELGGLVNNGLYLCYLMADNGSETKKAKLQIAVLK